MPATDDRTALVIDRGASGVRSIQELQQRMETILAVMANVLEEGKDYGRIPGTDKPTLYKPGAEKLLLTFDLGAIDPIIEDVSTSDEIRYRLRVPIETPKGRVQDVGIGEASSNEEKYRWRKPVCDEEFAETADHLRREKWFKGKSGERPYKGKQIRTSPADVANTILKMAHKRALVHGTLLATGASSVFNQDLEDFTEELRDSIIDVGEGATAAAKEKREVQRASEKNGGAKPAPPVDNGTGVFVTAPSKVKDVREWKTKKGEVRYSLLLVGDDTEYTTANAKMATELEGFKGTANYIRVSFKKNEWQGKTFSNIENFVAADVTEKPVAVAPASQSVSGKPVTQDEIPWK